MTAIGHVRSLGLAIAAGCLASALGAPIAGAQTVPDATVSARYKVNFAGLEVIDANVTIGLQDGRYRAALDYRSTGVGSWVSQARGQSSASGALRGDRVQAASYSSEGGEPGKLRSVSMGLSGGAVRTLKAEPPIDYAAQGRVPLTEASQRGVLDPLSATLMPVDLTGGVTAAACQRRLPVFDGYVRFDIQLSYKGIRAIQSPAFTGKAVVCSARYVPIAGHRPQHRATKFWQDNRDIEVVLMPLGTLSVAVPYAVRVRSQWGVIEIVTDQISVQAKTRAAAQQSGDGPVASTR